LYAGCGRNHYLTNRRIDLTTRPTGKAELEQLQMMESEISEIGDGEVLLRNL
jgi:NADPH-dependent curcumin reductase CurA